MNNIYPCGHNDCPYVPNESPYSLRKRVNIDTDTVQRQRFDINGTSPDNEGENILLSELAYSLSDSLKERAWMLSYDGNDSIRAVIDDLPTMEGGMDPLEVFQPMPKRFYEPKEDGTYHIHNVGIRVYNDMQTDIQLHIEKRGYDERIVDCTISFISDSVLSIYSDHFGVGVLDIIANKYDKYYQKITEADLKDEYKEYMIDALNVEFEKACMGAEFYLSHKSSAANIMKQSQGDPFLAKHKEMFSDFKDRFLEYYKHYSEDEEKRNVKELVKDVFAQLREKWGALLNYM